MTATWWRRRAPSKGSWRTAGSTRAHAAPPSKRTAELAAQGLRVLALAVKRMDQLGADRDADERDLTVYGLLGFQDPLRPEVPGAVAECQHAGIRITMITGDHALTAHAVAEAAGILHEDDLIVTADELTALTESERVARIRRADDIRADQPRTEVPHRRRAEERWRHRRDDG